MDLATPARRARLLTQLGIGGLVGVAALVWAMRGLDGRAVWQALSAARYAWILVALVCVLGVALGKTARWRALYGASEPRVAFADLFSALMITQMVNVLVPIRVGELVRIGLMKQAGQSGAVTLSTIAIEKSLDMVAAGLMAVLLGALAVAPDWLRAGSGEILLLGAALCGGLALVWYVRAWIERIGAQALAWGGWVPARWQARLLRVMHATVQSLGVLTGWRLLSRVLFWTTLVWLLSLGMMLALFTAFDLNLPLAAGVVLMLALSFSSIVPSPPAFIGVMQAIAVIVLGEYGVAVAVAVGFGIMLNIVAVAPLILLGSCMLWQRAVMSAHALRELWNRVR